MMFKCNTCGKEFELDISCLEDWNPICDQCLDHYYESLGDYDED